jgi:hypothetical protein
LKVCAVFAGLEAQPNDMYWTSMLCGIYCSFYIPPGEIGLEIRNKNSTRSMLITL